MHYTKRAPMDDLSNTTTEKQRSRVNRKVKDHGLFKIYSTILSADQAYISAAVTDNTVDVETIAERVYKALGTLLKSEGYFVVHERVFAGLEYFDPVCRARKKSLEACGIASDTPLTFVQGRPIKSRGLAGIQLRAFKPTREHDRVWTLYDNEQPVGRAWTRNDASFYMLQNIHGNTRQDRYHQACDMFDRAQAILQKEGASFKNVLRTWIYLSDILDWYAEFNRARNARFTEFGMLGLSEKENTEAEQIYLPASTGILGDNPRGAVGVMDVLAIAPDSKNVSIAQTAGVQQKSPYRYGSAFSRAMTLKETDVTHILLSGTASIDDHGKTVFQENTRAQIRKTFQVVEALIEHEGATLQDINEATVFLKDENDIDLYWQVVEEFGIKDFPAIFIVADVCRPDLLFEIDATIAY